MADERRSFHTNSQFLNDKQNQRAWKGCRQQAPKGLWHHCEYYNAGEICSAKWLHWNPTSCLLDLMVVQRRIYQVPAQSFRYGVPNKGTHEEFVKHLLMETFASRRLYGSTRGFPERFRADSQEIGLCLFEPRYFFLSLF